MDKDGFAADEEELGEKQQSFLLISRKRFKAEQQYCFELNEIQLMLLSLSQIKCRLVLRLQDQRV